MVQFCDKLFRSLFLVLSVAASFGSGTNLFAVNGFSMSSGTTKTIYGVPNSGWTSPNWNWGYGSGTGHDCAAICRSKYSTREARSVLIDELLSASTSTSSISTIDLEEVKLVMALKWQNGRWDGSDGGPGGYGDVLATMANAKRYEDDSTGELSLYRDMKERFGLLNPTDDDRSAMENLKEGGDDDGVHSAVLSCSGLVLKAMGFSNGW